MDVTHWEDYLSSNPQVCGGDVRVSGTRIPVAVVGHQRGRSTAERIRRNFGKTFPEGYRKAALAYAAQPTL